MKKFFGGLMAGLLLAVLLLVGGVFSLVKWAGRQNEPTVTQGSLLVFDWNGTLSGHQVEPSQAGLFAPVTLSTVLGALDEAARDERVQGLLIDGSPRLPREYLHEIGQAVDRFRAAGKPVLAHLELGMDGSYGLACLADKVALSGSASGGLFLRGPAVETLYMREGLERLGVEMRVLHVGEAKGFGERYVLDEMSAPVRENLGLLVADLFDEEARWIAEHRGLEVEPVRQALLKPDRLGISPQEALELGLVDELCSRAEWKDRVEEQFGEADRVSLSAWIRARPQWPSAEGSASEDHVAVVWAEGGIVPGFSGGSQVEINSRKLVELLEELREDESVKGVVLRVESGGGSALASDEIYLELARLDETKPLHVSMGTVAASGGYYISAPARRIWISPFSVTGSIGVVAVLPDFSGSAGKLGLSPQGIQPTALARLSAIGNPLDEAALAGLETQLQKIYAEFAGRVLAHRPIDRDALGPIAGGRVWSGRRAIELGLADGLGTLADAVDSLRAELGRPGLPVRHLPRVRSLLESLLDGDIKPGDLLPGFAALPALAAVDPELAERLREGLDAEENGAGPAGWMRAEWEHRIRD